VNRRPLLTNLGKFLRDGVDLRLVARLHRRGQARPDLAFLGDQTLLLHRTLGNHRVDLILLFGAQA
jgi:hypothetical protein